MPADDGLAPERQRLRKVIKIALKRGPFSFAQLCDIVTKINSVEMVKAPQDVKDAIAILMSQKEILERDELYYRSDQPPPKNLLRNLDDDWLA